MEFLHQRERALLPAREHIIRLAPQERRADVTGRRDQVVRHIIQDTDGLRGFLPAFLITGRFPFRFSAFRQRTDIHDVIDIPVLVQIDYERDPSAAVPETGHQTLFKQSVIILYKIIQHTVYHPFPATLSDRFGPHTQSDRPRYPF